MKLQHDFAVEYVARLLTFNTKWCGTINADEDVIRHVRRDAMAEFLGFLKPSQ